MSVKKIPLNCSPPTTQVNLADGENLNNYWLSYK